MYKFAACFVVLFVGGVRAEDADLIKKSAVRTTHSVVEGPVTTVQGGSGTVISVSKDHFYVLSCCHIAEHGGQINSGELRVITWDGWAYPAKVVAHDKNRDLSLIRAEGESEAKAVKIAKDEKYEAGTKVVKCGFPGGGPRVIAEGECADFHSTHTVDDSIVTLVATALSKSGDSGGGVFRESDTEFIGVIWGGLPDGLRATRLKDIRIFLKKAKFDK